jgi:hypothetical protein
MKLLLGLNGILTRMTEFTGFAIMWVSFIYSVLSLLILLAVQISMGLTRREECQNLLSERFNNLLDGLKRSSCSLPHKRRLVVFLYLFYSLNFPEETFM